MSIIRIVNNEKKVIANNLTDHNQLTGRDDYGAHPISAIRKLPEKLSALKEKDTELDQRVNDVESNMNTLNTDMSTIQGSFDTISEEFTALDTKVSGYDNAIAAVETGAKQIDLTEDNGELTFTDYEGNSTSFRSGNEVDDITIKVGSDDKIYTEGLKDGNSVATISTIRDEIDVVNTRVTNEVSTLENSISGVADDVSALTNRVGTNEGDIADIKLVDETQTSNISTLSNKVSALEGVGGYLPNYNFGKATPTQQELTNYAMQCIPSISSSTEIWNGTRVINDYDDHIWILNNTQDTDPVIFEWVNIGLATVNIATNSSLGVVKGSSSEPLTGSIDVNGLITINGLDNELNTIKTKLGTIEDGAQVNTVTSVNNQTGNIVVGDAVLTGASAPTANTIGKANQLYRDTTTNKVYICTNIDTTGNDPIYTWTAVNDDETIAKAIRDNTTYISDLSGGFNAGDITETTAGSVNIGYHNTVRYGQSVAIGRNILATNGALVIGKSAGSQRSSVVLGNSANAGTADHSIVLGNNAQAAYDYTVVVGDTAKAFNNYAIQLGKGTNNYANTLQIKDDNIYNHSTHTATFTNIQQGVNNTDGSGGAPVYGVLSGTTAPTTSTVGSVGQFYLDTVTTKLYKCDAVTAQGTDPETYSYTWTAVSRGLEVLTGNSDPTTSTVGELGQVYVNTSANTSWVCIYHSGNTYRWFNFAGNGEVGYDYSMIIGGADSSSKGISIGRIAKSFTWSDVAIGNGTQTSNGGIAIGNNANGQNGNIAIGNSASVGNYTNQIALGGYSNARNNSVIQLGSGTNSTANSFQIFNDNIYKTDSHTLTVQNATVNSNPVYGTITDTSAPTTTTVGEIGQVRINTTDHTCFICVNKIAQGTDPETYVYTWSKVDNAIKTAQYTSYTDLNSALSTLYAAGHTILGLNLRIGGTTQYNNIPGHKVTFYQDGSINVDSTSTWLQADRDYYFAFSGVANGRFSFICDTDPAETLRLLTYSTAFYITYKSDNDYMFSTAGYTSSYGRSNMPSFAIPSNDRPCTLYYI